MRRAGTQQGKRCKGTRQTREEEARRKETKITRN
jgi:hypothetical protein